MRYVKNILILALVAINLFFLAFFGWGMFRENAVKKQMNRELYTLMEKNGILLDTENIKSGGEMYRLDTSRNTDKEWKLAETLLGETTTVEQGGNITAYVGENGQAVFRAGGEFDISFTPGTFQTGDSIEGTTKKILKAMAVETADIDVSIIGDNASAATVCSWANFEVFNCHLQFLYSNGSLTQISGKYASDIKMTADKTEMSISSAATALMRFLHEVKEEKFTCAAITGVSPGYSFTAAVYGDGSLHPVWCIKADSGVYLVDAETGNTEQVIE